MTRSLKATTLSKESFDSPTRTRVAQITLPLRWQLTASQLFPALLAVADEPYRRASPVPPTHFQL